MKTKSFIFLCLLVLFIPIKIYSQVNSENKYGLVWYLNKPEVFDSARVQGKRIFALWGREKCGICNLTKQLLANDTLKPIVDEHYLLWHINYDKCKLSVYCNDDTPEACDEIKGYFDPLCMDATFISLPAICIIDPNDTVPVAYGLRHGWSNTEILRTMLVDNVANEPVISAIKPYGKAYIYDNELVLESASYDEFVSVYSIAGSLIDRFRKTDTFYTRDASNYPRGLFIVAGSSGWNSKILKK